MQHDLCVTHKIAGREKVHVRSSVGELTKKIFPTGAALKERSSESTPPLNPRTQRTLKERRDSRFSILFRKSRFREILYYIQRFVNGALLGTEWHAATRIALCCAPKGFSFLRRTLKQKGKVDIYLLVNRLFENIDARSDLDRSKYWSATSVLEETIIL